MEKSYKHVKKCICQDKLQEAPDKQAVTDSVKFFICYSFLFLIVKRKNNVRDLLVKE